MRNGHNVERLSLCDLLNSKPREITAFIHGRYTYPARGSGVVFG
jgi:hypothetical protein